jgi:hypothetical protein
MAINFFSTNNMTLPPEGPRVIPFNLDMAVSQSHEIDLTELTQSGYISYISGAWIDNADNGEDVTILVNATGQRVIVPANTQMSIPLFSLNPPKFVIEQGAAGDLCRVFFVNFPVFPWNGPVIP